MESRDVFEIETETFLYKLCLLIVVLMVFACVMIGAAKVTSGITLDYLVMTKVLTIASLSMSIYFSHDIIKDIRKELKDKYPHKSNWPVEVNISYIVISITAFVAICLFLRMFPQILNPEFKDFLKYADYFSFAPILMFAAINVMFWTLNSTINGPGTFKRYFCINDAPCLLLVLGFLGVIIWDKAFEKTIDFSLSHDDQVFVTGASFGVVFLSVLLTAVLSSTPTPAPSNGSNPTAP